jgi:hypothetical protein
LEELFGVEFAQQLELSACLLGGARGVEVADGGIAGGNAGDPSMFMRYASGTSGYGPGAGGYN